MSSVQNSSVYQAVFSYLKRSLDFVFVCLFLHCHPQFLEIILHLEGQLERFVSEVLVKTMLLVSCLY